MPIPRSWSLAGVRLRYQSSSVVSCRRRIVIYPLYRYVSAALSVVIRRVVVVVVVVVARVIGGRIVIYPLHCYVSAELTVSPRYRASYLSLSVVSSLSHRYMW